MGYLLCPLCCGRSFSSRKSLRYHLLSSESNISCPECHQQFDTIVELAYHLELETCDQQAVVICVTSEHVDKVRAGCDSAKSRGDSSLEETAGPMVFKEEVVTCSTEDVDSSTEDVDPLTKNVDQSWLPTDYEAVVSDALNVSHDSDAIKRWEQQVPDDETAEHYCNSCNCKVYGVLEHINKFHASETVILQNAEVLDTEVVDTEVVDTEVVKTEFGTEDDYEEQVGYLCESLDQDPTPAATGHSPVSVTASTTLESKHSVHNLVSNSASKKTKAKARLPKVYGTVDESNMVDAKTGIPYVRRIVHIEKFWEKEMFRLSSKDDGAESDSGLGETAEVRPRGRRKMVRVDDVAVPNKVDVVKAAKVTPKRKKPAPALVQAHMGQLLRSQAIKELKQSWGENNSGTHILERLVSVGEGEKVPGGATLCEVCGLKCRSNRSLRAHAASHDPAKKPFNKLLSEPATCEVCLTEFATAGGLKVHRRMHRPDNVQRVAQMNNKVEYCCDLCNMVCYSERTFRIHYGVHVPRPVGVEPETAPRVATTDARELDVLACKLCGETFSSNEDLKTHWQGHYPVAAEETVLSEGIGDVEDEDGDWFTCQRCGKRLAGNVRDVHERMHRGETHFGCSVCNKHFGSEVNLEFHMTTHRTEIELECLTCKTKFTDPALLKLHRKTHAGTNRPYPCGFCGRRFSRPHEKVKHERIHTGEKPYECATCGMRFRVGYCLKMHERIHTGVRPYSCESCGKTFRARSGYKQHIRLHSDVRAFACPFCPKTFKTVVQLAGHKKSHTKPYSCPHCGRRFATMYMVRSHVNTHAKSTLKHCCHICGASYGRDYALRDHIKSHGKNVPPPPDNEEEEVEEEVEEEGPELASDASNDTIL